MPIRSRPNRCGRRGEIALLQAQSSFVGRYDELRHRVSHAQRTLSLNEQLPRSFLELCLLLCTAAVAAVAFTHHTTAAALALVATFAAVGFRVLPSLNRVLLAATRNKGAMPSLEQIQEDLAEVRGPVPTAAVRGITGPVETIAVTDLSVSVAGREAPLLRDVTFDLQRGEMVGILGASGAGKTSLINAVLGFVPASSGAVLINGTDPVRGPESWGGRAAVVPQDVVVLDATLRENVAFGRNPEDIDDDRVLDALRLAHLDGILAELPDGMHTVLGESGARMSGGQRQRLGIARALYYDTDVLVLDEVDRGARPRHRAAHPAHAGRAQAEPDRRGREPPPPGHGALRSVDRARSRRGRRVRSGDRTPGLARRGGDALRARGRTPVGPLDVSLASRANARDHVVVW